MADNALLQALMGGQTSSAGQLASARYLPSESAWGIGANAVGQVAPLLNNPYASTGSNLGITIGSALFAGLLSGMAKNEANDSNANMFKLAGGAYNVPAADRASIVEQEPRLAPFVAALNQQERDLAIDTAKKKADKMLEYDPAVLQGEGTKAAMIEQGKIQGTIAGSGGDPLKNPDTPQYKLDVQRKAEEDARRAEIMKLPGASKLSATLTAIPALEELASIDTKTSDIPFVYQFIQAQDGGMVKDGEIQLVGNSNSLISKFRADLQGALDGKSMGVALKRQMVEEMKGVASAQHKNLLTLSQPILTIGQGRGATMDGMLGFPSDISKIVAPGKWVTPPTTIQGDPAAAQAEIQKRLAAGMNQMQNMGAIP